MRWLLLALFMTSCSSIRKGAIAVDVSGVVYEMRPIVGSIYKVTPFDSSFVKPAEK